MDKMPPLDFVTSVAHVSDLGPCVVVSFSGFEQGLVGQDRSFPITHRIVISREALADGIEFLRNWLNGISSTPPVVQ